MREGERIGPLRIERPLGAGGMGEVWLARDERLERRVAVKLLPESRSVDPAARGRMLREARAASALKHPSIVTVHDIGEHDGRAYIVMEYVEGETFDDLVRRRGRLPPAEAVDLLAQVADAVAVAHDAGILHRDLKAQNLMIDGAGRVKVLDFGLSKRTDGAPSQAPERAIAGTRDEVAVAETAMPLAPGPGDAPTTPAPATASGGSRTDEPQTQYGARMGTPGWAPPELIDGSGADARSDVFSLGVVLYHLLTGKMPFAGTQWRDLREQIDRGAAPPGTIVAGLPPALDAVVLAALDPVPARRPHSARALIASATAAVRPARRLPWVLGGAAAVAAGAVAIGLLGADDDPAPAPSRPAPAVVTADAAPPPAPEPVQITSLDGCAYSPVFLDDDTVSFDLTRDGTVDLYTLDLGGTPVRRTDLPGWEWRSVRGADPSEIVFLDQGDGYSQASKYDLDTGAVTRLFEAAGSVAQVGDTYYHAPAPHTVLRRRRGTVDELFLPMPPGYAVDTLAVSPDQAQLALLLFGENQIPRLCVTRLDRPELRCLDVTPGSARPSFSSRSDAIYYDGMRGIERVNLADGRVDEVAHRTVSAGGLAVAPSGATMVYSACATRGELVDVMSGALTRISDAQDALFPAFGPDGLLAYAATSDDGRRKIVVRDAGGTHRDGAVHADARLTDVAFSPDGRHLAYVVGSRSEPGIYALALSSGAVPNRLTEDQSDRTPVFAGGGIVFTRLDEQGTPRLMRMELDGSGAEPVSRRPRHTLDVDHARGRVLLSSPAGDYFYWWDPATGKESPGPVVPTPNGDVSLSPNGQWLLALHGPNGHVIHRLRLDRKAAVEVVHRLPGDLTTLAGAIDDRGNVIIALHRWAGELYRLDAPAGKPW